MNLPSEHLHAMYWKVDCTNLFHFLASAPRGPTPNTKPRSTPIGHLANVGRRAGSRRLPRFEGLPV